jgi:hypothetical protein
MTRNTASGFNIRVFGICVNLQQKAIVPTEICTIVGGQMFKNLKAHARNDLGGPTTCLQNPCELIEAIEQILFFDDKHSFDTGAIPRLQELAVFFPD